MGRRGNNGQGTTPPWQGKEGTGSDRRIPYKYPEARPFLANLMTTHTLGELQDLLTAGVEFSELGMVKTEAEHPVPGLDQLCISLEMRRFSRLDVLASVEEEYVEKIDLATFILSMLVARALEPRAVIPPGPAPEVTWPSRPSVPPQEAVVDKGKGVYVPSPKKMPSTRPKGILIGTSAVTAPVTEEEEDKVIPKDRGHRSDFPSYQHSSGESERRRTIGACRKGNH